MSKNKIMKLSRSLLKLILPIIFKILIKLRLNRRVINFLGDKSYYSNNYYDFSKQFNSLNLLIIFLQKNPSKITWVLSYKN